MARERLLLTTDDMRRVLSRIAHGTGPRRARRAQGPRSSSATAGPTTSCSSACQRRGGSQLAAAGIRHTGVRDHTRSSSATAGPTTSCSSACQRRGGSQLAAAGIRHTGVRDHLRRSREVTPHVAISSGGWRWALMVSPPFRGLPPPEWSTPPDGVGTASRTEATGLRCPPLASIAARELLPRLAGRSPEAPSPRAAGVTRFRHLTGGDRCTRMSRSRGFRADMHAGFLQTRAEIG